MLRFVVLTTLVAVASATYGSYGGGSYGGGLSSGASFGGLSSLKGFGGSLQLQQTGGYGQQLQLQQNSGYSGGLIPAAIQSRRTVQFYDVPTVLAAPAPLSIDVPANQQPINFLFRSASSPLNLESVHQALAGSYDETSSQDEPSVRVHTVTRPVVQKVNEIIAPYRQVTQQVQPVQEEVQALVARGIYAQQQQQVIQAPLLQQQQLIQKPQIQLQVQKPLLKLGSGYGGYGSVAKTTGY